MTIPRQLFFPRYWPTWLGVLLMSLLARLPQSVNYRLGVIIGSLFYYFARHRRHICDTNLKLCFPDNSPESHARLLRRTMRDQGIGLMETLRVWFRPVDKLAIDLELQNAELLDVEEGGAGVLIIGCHFTCLDVVGLLIGKRYGVDSFYRRHKNPVLEWMLSRSRGRFGEPIHRRDIKRALRKLREGRRLFYLPDQDYGRKSAEFVDFFGVKAATTIGTSTLAKGGRARTVIGLPRREDRGRRYVAELIELENFPSGDAADDARRINALIEQGVRRVPEQYMWVHRRFKTRPPGEAKVY